MATSLYATLRHKAFLLSDAGKVQGSDIRLKGDVTTGFPASGNKVMPAGAVVVKESGDGLYYIASSADGASAGDINTAAVVTSKEAPDGDWKSKVLTWKVYYKSGDIFGGTVTAAGTDDDVTKWVTLLNANTAFGAHVLASADTELVLTTVAKGDVRLYVSLDLDTGFNTDDGSTSSDEAVGTEADYRVLMEQTSTVDLNGASRTSDLLPALTAGHFDESELYGLSDEAKAVLQGRGSIFA